MEKCILCKYKKDIRCISFPEGDTSICEICIGYILKSLVENQIEGYMITESEQIYNVSSDSDSDLDQYHESI
jgi:hypothetical protein